VYETIYPSDFIGRFSREVGERDVLHRLRAICEHGDEGDIVGVSAAVVFRSGVIHREAERTLDALFSRVSPEWLASHTENLRGIVATSFAHERQPVRAVTPWLKRAATALGGRERHGWATHALRTFSRDGHVREAALRKIAVRSDGTELPFLLLRRNDWVAQVRDVAAAELDRRVQPVHVAAWARQLGLLERLEAGARADHGPFAARVHALLRSDAGHRALLDTIAASDRGLRRAAARILLDGALPVSDIEALLATIDPALWIAAARRIWAGPDAERSLALAIRLATHRFAPLAAEALAVVATTAPDVAAPLLDHALFSKRALVRRVARFHLARCGVDVEARYAEVLMDDSSPPGQLATALAGFGESSTPAEADLARNFVAHADRRVRRAAVRALARLASDEIDIFVNALWDPDRQVCRAGADALIRRPACIPFDTLVDLARSGPEMHHRVAAARLSVRHSPGLGGLVLLEAAAAAKGEGRTRVLQCLERWLHRVTPPAARLETKQLDTLRAALERHQASLPDEIVTRARNALS